MNDEYVVITVRVRRIEVEQQKGSVVHTMTKIVFYLSIRGPMKYVCAYKGSRLWFRIKRYVMISMLIIVLYDTLNNCIKVMKKKAQRSREKQVKKYGNWGDHCNWKIMYIQWKSMYVTYPLSNIPLRPRSGGVCTKKLCSQRWGTNPCTFDS